MNDILIRAVLVVTCALILYSIGVVTEQRKRWISNRVLLFLSLGVLFDVSSTALMIIGSRKIPITVHGFIGYSALLAMLIDTILVWRFWLRNRAGQCRLWLVGYCVYCRRDHCYDSIVNNNIF